MTFLNYSCLDFRYSNSRGLYPAVFNLATHAVIESNATCGEHKSEVYCTLTEQGGTQRCGVCDTQDPDKAHPPR